MIAKYKNPQMQKLYEGMLALAADTKSELYHEGQPWRGAGHRAAFWDGFSGKFTLTGPTRSANVVAGTLSAACFAAGREWARLSTPRPGRGGAGRNQGRKPKDAKGETMRARGLRMTDAQWAAVQVVGLDVLRDWVMERAAAMELEAANTARAV